MAKSVEEYLSNLEYHQDGVIILRKIVLKTELQETIKWGQPAYTINGKNVLGLGAHKSYFGF